MNLIRIFIKLDINVFLKGRWESSYTSRIVFYDGTAQCGQCVFFDHPIDFGKTDTDRARCQVHRTKINFSTPIRN